MEWVYKTFLNAEGNFEKYKVRLIAKGYKQRETIDYYEVFAPIERQEKKLISTLIVSAICFDGFPM